MKDDKQEQIEYHIKQLELARKQEKTKSRKTKFSEMCNYTGKKSIFQKIFEQIISIRYFKLDQRQILKFCIFAISTYQKI